MTEAVSVALQAYKSSTHYEALKLAFAIECVERVRHLLEDERVVGCLDTQEAYARGCADRSALDQAAAEARALANQHQGSQSLDGVGHAAVSASYSVASALAGRAVEAADYAAYAVVYGDGGYDAVYDPESFMAETSWQLATLARLAGVVAAQ